MDLILTGSRLEDETSSPIDHQSGPIEASKPIPIIYVVAPDEADRESLQRLVEFEGWHPQIFASAEEFLTHPFELVPSCLLLDVSLPGLSGLELQKSAAAEHPHIPIIFLSAKGDIPTVVRAMKAGAVEFLTQPCLDSELLTALRVALDRSRKVVARETDKRALQICYASLSSRQRQVMALVSAGLLNKQVGVELGISEITVKAHRGQVMQKMQANSFADLIKMAAKLGLIRMKELPRLRRDDSSASFTGVLLDSYPTGTLEAACAR
jgi:FixJ family two-component response regulator